MRILSLLSGRSHSQMTSDISNIVPDIIKPFVDLVWFTHSSQLLIGWRNTGMLYIYLATALGVLHLVTPSFDQLVLTRTRLEGQLRSVFGTDTTDSDTECLTNAVTCIPAFAPTASLSPSSAATVVSRPLQRDRSMSCYATSMCWWVNY